MLNGKFCYVYTLDFSPFFFICVSIPVLWFKIRSDPGLVSKIWWDPDPVFNIWPDSDPDPVCKIWSDPDPVFNIRSNSYVIIQYLKNKYIDFYV